MVDKPNVEKIVIAWLTELLGDDWPVYGDQPKPRPIQYVMVDRTGGPRESMVLDQAEILIEVYHKNSRQIASDKANEIVDALPQLTAYESITRVKSNSLVNLDDLLRQYQRYQIYCDIFNRR